ncbi:hypothetical protein HC752_20275 [Vibrio sp. S9_S30]|uniref:hypothetical protein n=1 Tax=Vibrio sp. S9_S30 TaxID=2720226 RepID=UPI001680A718|nr:hypothetical protein [Vibrio sp. S9_S30]MBD1559281.1 hypothetical protein [Vibrio sp. S9_S30]
MRDFEILEKCEHYFRCNIDGTVGKHCRIIIDEFSQDLPLGHFKLHVEEITDKQSHHASDAVFKLTLPLSQQDSIAICTLNTGKKNVFTYKECLRLGGKWEPILNEWVFSASVQRKVEQLSNIVHSAPITVEAEFKETLSESNKGLTLFGFELVKGLKINHLPIFHKGVTLQKGDISFIPGKNSKTIVRAGTVIRITVPELILTSKNYREDYLAAVNIKTIRGRKPGKRTY